MPQFHIHPTNKQPHTYRTHPPTLLFFTYMLAALPFSHFFLTLAHIRRSDSADPVTWGCGMPQFSRTERVSAVIAALAQRWLPHRHNNVLLLFLSMIHSRPLTQSWREVRNSRSLTHTGTWMRLFWHFDRHKHINPVWGALWCPRIWLGL